MLSANNAHQTSPATAGHPPSWTAHACIKRRKAKKQFAANHCDDVLARLSHASEVGTTNELLYRISAMLCKQLTQDDPVAAWSMRLQSM